MINILIEHLIKSLTPYILEGLDSIFADVKENQEAFKLGLQGLERLGENHMSTEGVRIDAKNPKIKEMIHAIGVQVRLSFCWKNDEGPKIPKLKDFIHHCYIACANKFLLIDKWTTKACVVRAYIEQVVEQVIRNEAFTMCSISELMATAKVKYEQSLTEKHKHKRKTMTNTYTTVRDHSTHETSNEDSDTASSDNVTISSHDDDDDESYVSTLNNETINSFTNTINEQDHFNGNTMNSTESDHPINHTSIGESNVKSMPIGLILNGDSSDHIERISMPTVSVNVDNIIKQRNIVEQFGDMNMS